MAGQLGLTNISTKLQRVATLSRERPQMVWNTLAHHIDLEFLHEAFRLVRKDGAPGVDGMTAAEYAANLDENLARLLEAFKSGSYRAPPVRRVYIPKDNGQQRPIGIPTIEDKTLQRAVAMVLSAVYEQDFLDCSFGFRPGRSAHQALAALQDGLMSMWGGYVIELDIESFFDNLSHSTLRSFLDKRIRDGVLRRAIGKWLNAGVLENKQVQRAEKGSPQGGVVSPVLANIFLHEVLDLWFEREVKPRMRGKSFMVRYADDGVLVFEKEDDARRVMDALPKRFARFGLKLHPEKTRLVQFCSPRRSFGGRGATVDKPGSFDFLGFCHYWAVSRKGHDVVKRKTAKKRFAKALQRISEWCSRNRHKTVDEQHQELSQKMRGHFNYYGVIGNGRAISQFQFAVCWIWLKWLRRRSWRTTLTWERFQHLLKRLPLPVPHLSARA
jgi:group II intron reverse transcriptase/maturase